MASFTVKRVKSATLTANTVDTVTFTSTHRVIEVLHRGTSGTLWVRADGGAASVAGDECYAVQPYEAVIFSAGPQPPSVSVIASEAVAYTVTGVNS